MCGRFVSTTPLSDLAERLDVDEVRTDDERPNWNVTPRSSVLIVAENAEHQRVLDRVRWGLVPSWAKNLAVGDKLINARAESVKEKPAYRRAFLKRRCLIPVDGFYEWKVVPGRKTKQPVYIHRVDGAPIVFAGLYENWKDKADPDAEWVRSCSIVTTNANQRIAPVHNRMPVILPPEHFEGWLDPDNHDVDALTRLLLPAPDDLLSYYPISTLVNRPANNGPELLDPVPDDALLG
jgi:putative SOS response-associated peptidase YedK